jgi:hypothetical protein
MSTLLKENEPVADEHDQRHAITQLVRTGRGSRRIGPGHFVQEPVRGSAQALLVLLSVRGVGLAIVGIEIDSLLEC